MKFAIYTPYVTEDEQPAKDGYILIKEDGRFDRIEHKTEEDFKKYLESQGMNVKVF